MRGSETSLCETVQGSETSSASPTRQGPGPGRGRLPLQASSRTSSALARMPRRYQKGYQHYTLWLLRCGEQSINREQRTGRYAGQCTSLRLAESRAPARALIVPWSACRAVSRRTWRRRRCASAWGWTARGCGTGRPTSWAYSRASSPPPADPSRGIEAGPGIRAGRSVSPDLARRAEGQAGREPGRGSWRCRVGWRLRLSPGHGDGIDGGAGAVIKAGGSESLVTVTAEAWSQPGTWAMAMAQTRIQAREAT